MTINQTDPRIAGKRGKRPAVRRPQLDLSLFRIAAPAPPPPTGNVSGGITAWGMDGNDQYGDCGPAATDHYQVAKSDAVDQIGKLGGVGPVALYFEYGIAQGEPGPEPDQGVDNATWLDFLYRKGVIEAYAQLDHTNLDEVHAAMLNFGGVLIGVNLTDDAEQLFNAHQPWTTAQGEQPDPSLGHDILLVAYDASGETFVTWGALQLATGLWDTACVDEAWVIVTSDDAARNGVDLAALQAEINALGGTGIIPSVPPVPPQPAPVPPQPVPTPIPPSPAPVPTVGFPRDLYEAAKRVVEILEEHLLAE